MVIEYTLHQKNSPVFASIFSPDFGSINSSTISSSKSDSVTKSVPETSMRGPIVRPLLAILKPNQLFYIPFSSLTLGHPSPHSSL